MGIVPFFPGHEWLIQTSYYAFYNPDAHIHTDTQKTTHACTYTQTQRYVSERKRHINTETHTTHVQIYTQTHGFYI